VYPSSKKTAISNGIMHQGSPPTGDTHHAGDPDVAIDSKKPRFLGAANRLLI
jgi:hypothetical protein